jgi:transposase
MLQMANYEFIRKEHFLHGKSIRRIARETDYSRQSVRKALKSLEIPQYTLTKEKSKPVIDAVKSIIIKWLEEDQKAPVKQKHTAKRIYDRLVAEHGFKGGESTIRAYVKTLRQEINAHIPQEFPMGEYAQFDWGTADIILNGQQTTIQLFCMRLTYSRKIFVKAFMNQKQEALLQGHVDAFDYFGGVPKTIVYDNLKTVVKRILKGKKREETERFIQLKSHYLFESDFCEPGKGNQKGQVEHLVKYARANFLVPLPKVDSLETLNQM